MSVEIEYPEDILSMIISSHIMKTTDLTKYHIESLVPLAVDVIPMIDKSEVIIIKLYRTTFQNLENRELGMYIKYIAIEQRIEYIPTTSYVVNEITEMDEQIKEDNKIMLKHNTYINLTRKLYQNEEDK